MQPRKPSINAAESQTFTSSGVDIRSWNAHVGEGHTLMYTCDACCGVHVEFHQGREATLALVATCLRDPNHDSQLADLRRFIYHVALTVDLSVPRF